MFQSIASKFRNKGSLQGLFPLLQIHLKEKILNSIKISKGDIKSSLKFEFNFLEEKIIVKMLNNLD